MKLSMMAAWQSRTPFEAIQHCHDSTWIATAEATVLLKAVMDSSFGLTSFLEGNPNLQNDIGMVLASRLDLRSLLKHVHKPLEKRFDSIGSLFSETKLGAPARNGPIRHQ
jgi:hypothetical protein